MKTGQIVLYVIGAVVIGAIIYYLVVWRKKLETEKQQLETGAPIAVRPTINITEATGEQPTEAITIRRS